MLDHLFGHLEIGDHAVPERPNGLDIARSAAEHQLGFFADGQNLLAPFDAGDRDNGGLIEHNPPPLDVDQGVGGAEIDRHIGGQ